MLAKQTSAILSFMSRVASSMFDPDRYFTQIVAKLIY